MTLAVASSGRALWYLTRGSGAVALVLLTASLVLGVLEVRRVEARGWPRHVLDAIHRYASLLAVVFLVLHILTSVLDGFGSITLLDAVIPFAGTYRPLWLGFGAIAFDVIIAVTVTSLLRQRIGYRTWRAVHWAAYASWPVAMLHSVGTGSDIKQGWMLLLSGVCLLAVVVAVAVRALDGSTDRLARGWALSGTAVSTLALLFWLPAGPLAKGWALRAGTPVALLGGTAASGAARGSSGKAPASGPTTPTQTTSAGALSPPGGFSASFAGTVSQQQAGNGLAILRFALTLAGGGDRRLNVSLEGTPTAGGVSMTSGEVTFGTGAHPTVYSGPITTLSGNRLTARVSAPGNVPLTLDITLASTNNGASTVQGSVIGARAQ